MKRYFLLFILLLIPILTTFNPANNKFIALGVERGAPGVFEYNNESYGYVYDLFSEWAEQSGQRLVMKYYSSREKMLADLKKGKLHFALAVGEPPTDIHFYTVLEYKAEYAISSVARLPKNITEEALADSMRGKRIYLGDGAAYTPFVRSLAEDEYDLTFEDTIRNDFRIEMALLINIHRFNSRRTQSTVTLGEGLYSSLLTESMRKKVRFESWYDHFLESNKGEAVVKRNSRDNLFYHYTTGGYIRPLTKGGTSPYDSFFKEVGEQEGVDWRLLSAVAFAESKYHNDAVSPNGAVGLMQVLPQTAKIYGFDEEELLNPYINITAAARHLKYISGIIRVSLRRVSPNDNKVAILLATYNCGYGHVLDVKNLVTEAGGDPALWYDLSDVMVYMGEEEYYENPIVQHGRFQGVKTVEYVSNVLEALEELNKRNP